MSDCELPQYYVCTFPVARKEHECCECNAPILVGEKHIVVNACYEGRPDRYRQHLLCEQACEMIRGSDLNDGDCIYFGGLKEFWRDLPSYFGPKEEMGDRKRLWFMMLKIYRRERKHLRMKVVA